MVKIGDQICGHHFPKLKSSLVVFLAEQSMAEFRAQKKSVLFWEMGPRKVVANSDLFWCITMPTVANMYAQEFSLI